MQNSIDGFLKYLKENKKSSDNTIAAYRRDITAYNDFLLKNSIRTVSEIKNHHLNNYISYKSAIGASLATVNRNLASIKAFYKYLATQELIDMPAVQKKLEAKKEKTLPQILSSEEMDHLLSAPDTNTTKGIRDKAMLELLYATGVKVSELILVKMCDLNTDVGFLKCKDDRILPIYKIAVKCLTNYLRNARPFLIADISPESPLFTNSSVEIMTRQGFFKILKYYQKKADISTPVTPQTLRHSFAVHMLENGADLKFIKELLGHSDISTTQMYATILKNKFNVSYKKFHPRSSY